MISNELQYISLLERILSYGKKKNDRTLVGTIGLINQTIEVDLSEGNLPIQTIRKINYKNAIEEFLFMWRGHTNTKLLEEKGVNIWKGNTSRQFLDNKGLSHFPEGEMGEMYGKNLRNFNGWYDQLHYIVDTIKKDPDSRRITATMQNVSEREQSVLDCCHGVWLQFYVDKEEETISLMMTQRACDLVLGYPVNVVFYSLFLDMVCRITGYVPDKLYMNLNDVHIYKNHIDKVEQMLQEYYSDERNVYSEPTFYLKNTIKNIEDVSKLQFDDFVIQDYKYNKPIKFEMAI